MLRTVVIFFKYMLIASCCLHITSCESKTKDEAVDKLLGELKVEVNGTSVTVHQARVSKYPMNMVWEGYQRPVNQTEIANFAYFDFKKNAVVKITSSEDIKDCKIRPTEFGITPVVKGKSVEFTLTEPCQFVVEFDGHHEALHLFVNPEKLTVDRDANARYFGPGIHEAGVITMRSNEMVYIDEGAIVYGAIQSENASNIKIVGKGILDSSHMNSGHIVSLKGVSNAHIEGVILKDPADWAAVPYYCNGVTFDNVKLIGFWRYNADGIDIVNSSNVTIKNSFLRTFDDCIAIKGQKAVYDKQKIIENIKVDNCVLWNDWGKCFEFGAETVVDIIRDVTISNCYIPHFTMVAMSMQNGDRGHIENVRFENISIEEPIKENAMLKDEPMDTSWWGKTIGLGITGTQWSQDNIRGSINNVSFQNIRHIGSGCTGVDLSGYDKDHKVTNINIKDYYVNGTKVTKTSNLIHTNEFVSGVTVE